MPHQQREISIRSLHYAFGIELLPRGTPLRSSYRHSRISRTALHIWLRPLTVVLFLFAPSHLFSASLTAADRINGRANDVELAVRPLRRSLGRDPTTKGALTPFNPGPPDGSTIGRQPLGSGRTSAICEIPGSQSDY